jgi:hypothetical protein
MTELPDGQRCPSHEHVFSLLGFAPSSTVLAESRRDGFYLALVESPDGSQADGILLEFVDGQWSRLDEQASRNVARAVGCDLSRAGSTIRIVLNEAVFHEAVSSGGWWAFVARVNDYHLLENAILLPGPAEPQASHQPPVPQPALAQPAMPQAAMAQPAMAQPAVPHLVSLEPADPDSVIDLSDVVESPTTVHRPDAAADFPEAAESAPVVRLPTATEPELKGRA